MSFFQLAYSYIYFSVQGKKTFEFMFKILIATENKENEKSKSTSLLGLE